MLKMCAVKVHFTTNSFISICLFIKLVNWNIIRCIHHQSFLLELSSNLDGSTISRRAVDKYSAMMMTHVRNPIKPNNVYLLPDLSACRISR